MQRRQFMKYSVSLAGAFASLNVQGTPTSKTPRVSLVRDPGCFNGDRIDRRRVGELLDKLLRVQFDVADPVDVFRRYFTPGERIGIKVNCLSGRRMSTHVELVDKIVERLISADIPAEDIIIWDRMNEDLRRGGFELRSPGEAVACAGCDVLGYESKITVHRSIGSLFTKAVTRLCTAQINVPVLKDHGIVGVTIGMKNFFGAIHNPNKYHPNRGDPYVADLYSHPDIGGKVRMTIVDALEVQPEGGPPYQPEWVEKYGGLLTGNDPVALDRVGWDIIEKRRNQRGLPSLKEANREPTYIHTAADLNLGVDDLSAINIRRS
ncbi:hypothetical protein CEE37_09100 [candidate division LCP-89 bacterium B3_LCP]|uniref:DUF362 domain-containing protein n=1 Tax=candidate division LCP-89 bacterium B3_LCP TaxID=2012998 RepID=A0A532UZT4_UNCL8|nr:MAG: hypothetical protein CEE37_09100 [candidate division LCP-89 bacterium B3_LCP]